MTRDEADAEAKRRWGPQAYAYAGDGPGMQGIVTIERRSVPTVTELGRGRTWEEALTRAEEGVWREAHPFSIWWREYAGVMFLKAECLRCGILTEHRLRVIAPIATDWLARAQSAERALQKQIQDDPRWQKCSHKGGELRPNRKDLERVVASREQLRGSG